MKKLLSIALLLSCLGVTHMNAWWTFINNKTEFPVTFRVRFSNGDERYTGTTENNPQRTINPSERLQPGKHTKWVHDHRVKSVEGTVYAKGRRYAWAPSGMQNREVPVEIKPAIVEYPGPGEGNERMWTFQPKTDAAGKQLMENGMPVFEIVMSDIPRGW
jgi:hypothetical protein